MQVTATISGLDQAILEAKGNLAAAMVEAMTAAGTGLKEELRDQVEAAGMGPRLAKTWQLKIYPQGRDSLEPAASAFSKAPHVIDAFARGATIVPRSGRRFLAVPTEDCPRISSGRAMTPREVEQYFGRRLIAISPNDRGFHTPSRRRAGVVYLVMKKLVIRKATQRWRNASAKELAGKSRNPRPVQAVIMFVLVPQVKMRKSLDLNAAANYWAGQFASLLANAGNG